MARPQESSNKKENEKNKQRKRKEKEQRREDRKLNNDGGKSFDDMIAYVDEFGRFSTSPPDPLKKTTVNAEEITTGVAKRDSETGTTLRTGTVQFFNTEKGYGFIKDSITNESIFIHQNGLVDAIKENDKVNFETEIGLKGLQAFNVKLLK